MLTDLEFFEQEVERYLGSIQETLLNKRKVAGVISDDPEEELAEVYSEVEVIEQDFKKALDICQHMLGHSKELFTKNQEIQAEHDQLKHEYQMMLNQNMVISENIQQSEDTWKQNQIEQSETEAELKLLKEELDRKEEELMEKTRTIISLGKELE